MLPVFNCLKKLVTRKPKTYTTTQIASEIGLSSKELNWRLYQKGIQYYTGGMWILYSHFRGKGLTSVKTFRFKSDGNTLEKCLTVWTEKGREFIHDKIIAEALGKSLHEIDESENPIPMVKEGNRLVITKDKFEAWKRENGL